MSVGGSLRQEELPMRLYQKAKQLGTWNPVDIDLGRDRADWDALEGDKRESILWLTPLFQEGEEGVTVDLLPLIMVVASEGRIEEELFLTTFLFEEGKHVEFFGRFLDEVCEAHDDLSGWHTPATGGSSTRSCRPRSARCASTAPRRRRCARLSRTT